MPTLYCVRMEHIASAENLSLLIDYDPETGEMVWMPRPAQFFAGSLGRTADHAAANWNSRYAGKPALSFVGNHGYKCGNIGNKSFLAHRVAMAICLGTWDFGFVDHINGDKTDNRRENLRLCTNAQNLRNGKSRGGASKYKGVSFHKQNKNWVASIMVDGMAKHIGSFAREEDAARAYNDAAMMLHGDFARLNVIE
jgi:hypothetical protein